MRLMTIKEFAADQCVSYEAIRRLVAKYRDELSGHVIRQGRQRLLDEEAMSFLASRRRENPIVVVTQDLGDEVRRLESENAMLKERLLAAQEKAMQLQGSQREAIEARARLDYLLEDKERLSLEVAALHDRLEDARARLRDAEREAGRYERTLFGLYRRRPQK